MKDDPKKPRRPLTKPEEGDIIHADNPDDYLSPIERNETLFINFGIMKFGTSDRLQGASMFLAIILLFLVMLALVGGIWNWAWAKEVLVWLTTPLMLVIGVAVGRAGAERHNE